jgi:hypothetical protein
MEKPVSESLKWICISREKLPEALTDHEFDSSVEISNFLSPNGLRTTGVALGYATFDAASNIVGNLPALLILDESRASEIFSWLDVYAAETFPISQFGRVMSFSDWEIFHSETAARVRKPLNLGLWASLILGEILAQGDTEMEISELPLSRVGSTFSASVARAHGLHSSIESNHLCINRLHKIESDSRFSRRAVNVEMLVPMWTLTSTIEGFFYQDTYDVVIDVLATIADSQVQHLSEALDLKNYLAKYSGLRSDSVEARVVAFRSLETAVFADANRGLSDSSVAALVACGAFLVGRGTSHFFLLNKAARRHPVALAWFGLLGGLFGPTGWDAQWSKAVNGISKHLRGSYQLDSPTLADVSWIEYSWLTRTRSSTDLFGVVPKLYPRLLSVEVIPGVSCQFRFANPDSLSAARVVPESPESELYRVELKNAVDLLRVTSEKLTKLVGQRGSGRNMPQQNELPLNTDLVSIQSAPRKRRLKASK